MIELPDVQATADAIHHFGGHAVALVRDVSQETDVADFIQTAVREHGGRSSSLPVVPPKI